MKNNPILITSLALLWMGGLVSCTPGELPEEGEGDAVFSFTGQIGNEPVAWEAGKGGKFMFTQQLPLGTDAFVWSGNLANDGCPDCPGFMEIGFRVGKDQDPQELFAAAEIPYFRKNDEGPKFQLVVSADPTTTGSSFQWDMGDGGMGSGPTFVHFYPDSGPATYLVCLRTLSPDGCISTICNEVNFDDAACSVDFTAAPFSPGSNLMVFRARATGRQPVRYRWNFGDGTTAGLANPAYFYPSGGSYLVCLTATDADGCVSTWCREVAVQSQTCTAGFSYELSRVPGPDTLQLGSVRIRWRDTDGQVWDSGLAEQDNNARFEVLSAETYAEPGAQGKIWKIRARITCLVSDGNQTLPVTGEAVFGIGTGD